MYETWTTKDGRKVSVGEMTDLHLVHTIRAIIDGRVFPQPLIPYANGDERDGMDDAEVWACIDRDVDRENWLTVLKAEAIRRDLDWTKAPTRKVTVFNALLDGATIFGKYQGELFVSELVRRCAELGIPVPTLDVCVKTGRATYLHWNTNQGTPLAG